ncbi:hypothetical protein HHI36_016569 [Cryptolaemus montrouzieri]|uniref:Endonuclease/exonuclease/phosphatase domain-containing protein n=1 Tax=Cryptolaemus montrouzieri TaxID=559131 RepID=A0ABD2NKC2_9CUCU
MSNIFATSSSNLVDRLGRSNALVCGDFNCTTIDWNPSGFGPYKPNNVSAKYSNIIGSLSFCQFSQLNYEPNSNDRILDLILCNENIVTEITHCSAPLVREDANHTALEFVINIEAMKYIRENIRFRNFKRADYTIINSQLNSVPVVVVLMII